MSKKKILRPNIFDRFRASNENFAVLHGHVYTCHPDRKSDVNWHFCNEQHALVESESIRNFTLDELLEKRQEVEEYLDVRASILLDAKNKGLAKVRTLAKNFAMQNVFDDFCDYFYIHQAAKKEEDVVAVQIPDLQNLQLNSIKLPNVFVYDGVVYDLHTCHPDVAGKVDIHNTTYGTAPHCNLKEFADKFHDMVHDALSDFVKQNNASYAKAMEDLSSFKPTTQHGMFSYRHKSGNVYQLCMDIKPYVMKVDDRYYSFGANKQSNVKKAVAAVDVEINNSSYKVTSYPYIVNMPYDHPFVYSWGDICFIDEKRWQDKGIYLTDTYRINSQKGRFALKEYMEQIPITLCQGYIHNINPVNEIKEYTPVATRRSAVENFCQQHGISHKRIFGDANA